ncbi:MAG: metal-sensing transcriptional repressor [Chitinimonas sp.]|nr:metal-sensing transcriptional repressor [Chitinimonas sp.]
MMKHESHPDILNRLKRANGHLQKIITMIEAERSCLELAQQLQAVESAITNAKRKLIQDHIDHCLEHVGGETDAERRAALEEFKQIAKYL